MDGHDAGAPSPFDDGGLYDALFHDFLYDLDFYLGLAKEAGGPVLEVACGTGRILLPCLRAGIDIDGLDLFSSMLESLRAKAAAVGLSPHVYRADMRDFRLSRRYRLVIIPFNAFLHNLTTEDQVGTLRCCRDHLEAGGLLTFNIFFPGLDIVSSPQGAPMLEHETRHPETGLRLRIYDTRSLDRIHQIQNSTILIQEIDAQGRVAHAHVSKTSIRWIYKPELELLLEKAGFKRFRIFGGFDRRPLRCETDEMVVFAWKE